jgi:hypothetical protein
VRPGLLGTAPRAAIVPACLPELSAVLEAGGITVLAPPPKTRLATPKNADTLVLPILELVRDVDIAIFAELVAGYIIRWQSAEKKSDPDAGEVRLMICETSDAGRKELHFEGPADAAVEAIAEWKRGTP